MATKDPTLPFVEYSTAKFYSSELKEAQKHSSLVSATPTKTRTTRISRSAAKKIVNLDSDQENIDLNILSTPTRGRQKRPSVQVKTPKRNQRRETKPDLSDTDEEEKSTDEVERGATPPKVHKSSARVELSPESRLLQNLNLDEENESTLNAFDKSKGKYQNARQALHSTAPINLPGREHELSELESFLRGHVNNKTSGTLYISGPPGTGKTACLSKILQMNELKNNYKVVYVNCTAVKSSGAIYSKICQEIGIKVSGHTEKDYLTAIDKFLKKPHKMILMVLDEIDQLDSRKQTILYTIFEWPSRVNSRIALIGIANALDLTDRILPRLQARCELKPKLMHFAPYSKQQIMHIITERLQEAGVNDVFSPIAVQMLAGKVAAVSGDVRIALDIGRRVVERCERNRKQETDQLEELQIVRIQNGNTDIQNVPVPYKEPTVELKEVMNVLNNVYGTSQMLDADENGEDAFPLQQKILLCTLLLMLRKGKNKDINVGRLHDVYKRVCNKRNILALDQAEFTGLCSLVDSRGIVRVTGKKEPRLNKVLLQWDVEEVGLALKDKQLMASILEDTSVLGTSNGY